MLRFILQSSVRREVKSVLKTKFNICSVVARGIRISTFMASKDEIDEYRKKAKLAVCCIFFTFINSVYIVLLVMSIAC